MLIIQILLTIFNGNPMIYSKVKPDFALSCLIFIKKICHIKVKIYISNILLIKTFNNMICKKGCKAI